MAFSDPSGTYEDDIFSLLEKAQAQQPFKLVLVQAPAGGIIYVMSGYLRPEAGLFDQAFDPSVLSFFPFLIYQKGGRRGPVNWSSV
jgi:hypothetical protein